MKRDRPCLPSVLLVLAVASVASACSDDASHASETRSEAPPAKPGGATSFETMKQDALTTIDSAKQVLAEKQAEFKKSSEAQLAVLETKIDELKAKASQASADAKPELERIARELEEQRARAATKLGEWKATSADTWQGFTLQVEETLHDLDQKVDQALAKAK